MKKSGTKPALPTWAAPRPILGLGFFEGEAGPRRAGRVERSAGLGPGHKPGWGADYFLGARPPLLVHSSMVLKAVKFLVCL